MECLYDTFCFTIRKRRSGEMQRTQSLPRSPLVTEPRPRSICILSATRFSFDCFKLITLAFLQVYYPNYFLHLNTTPLLHSLLAHYPSTSTRLSPQLVPQLGH
jgi:hypothetical protein